MPARVLRVLVAGLVLTVVLLMRGPASPHAATAAGPVDQQYLGPANSNSTLYSNVLLGQSFTAGRTGLLDQVAVFIERTGSPGPITVQIQKTSSGVPGGPVLATTTVAESAISTAAGWLTVPFSSPAVVLNGQQYAITLASGGDGSSTYYSLYLHGANPYAGGTSTAAFTPSFVWQILPGYDFLFQTFVSSLSVSLTADVTPKPLVPSGQPLTFFFEVTNTGQAPLTGVTFGAILPAGTTPTARTFNDDESPGPPCLLSIYGQRAGCAIGTLQPGQRTFIIIDAVMNYVALGTNLCATGQVNAGPAGATVTRQAQACTRVGAPLPRPDLRAGLSCSVVTTPIVTVSCTVTVTNMGNAPAVIPNNANLVTVEMQSIGLWAAYCSMYSPLPAGYGVELLGTCLAPGVPVLGRVYAIGDQTLGVGQSVSDSFSLLGVIGAGSVRITAIADPDSRIVELSEGNNVATPADVTYP